MAEPSSMPMRAEHAFSHEEAAARGLVGRLLRAGAETVGPIGAWEQAVRNWVDHVVAVQGPSDAPYHNLEHTMNAALAAADILRGVALDRRLEAADWAHIVAATLLHDIGYVRGACAQDTPHLAVASETGEQVALPRGASDAALGPHHVARSMIHARERLAGTAAADAATLDAERVARAIACTRFPPDRSRPPMDPASEGGLVRAADLVSQLGDPRYLPRMTALYAEFRETGQAAAMGLASAADLVDSMPRFHNDEAGPLIGTALGYLGATPEGRLWLDRIEQNLALARDPGRMVGPAPGPAG